MATKTTKKPAESTPESTPAANGVAPAARGWVLGDEEALTAQLAAMEPETFARFMKMVGVLEHQQRRDTMAQARKRRIARMHDLHRGDTLDDVERMSLHLIGKLAMGHYLSRSVLADGGLDGLFQEIGEGIRESLAQVGTMELDIIGEGEAAKQEIADEAVADALAQVDAESDDEADDDSE